MQILAIGSEIAEAAMKLSKNEITGMAVEANTNGGLGNFMLDAVRVIVNEVVLFSEPLARHK